MPEGGELTITDAGYLYHYTVKSFRTRFLYILTNRAAGIEHRISNCDVDCDVDCDVAALASLVP